MTIRFDQPTQIFLLLILAWVLPVAAETESAGTIELDPQSPGMVVRARVPYLEGQEFTFLLPKTIGEQRMEFVNHPYPAPDWSGPDERGAVTCEWSPGVLIRYRIEMVPAVDYVDLHFEVQNLTDRPWEDVWMFTFLAPMGAPAFQDQAGERTWISVAGEPLRIAEGDWKPYPRPEMTFFYLREMEDTLRFVDGFGQTSDTRPDAPWMISTNERGDAWFGMAMPEAAFVFRNKDISSIHVAPLFGNLGPGEIASVHGRAYFAKGSLESAVERIEADMELLKGEESGHQ